MVRQAPASGGRRRTVDGYALQATGKTTGIVATEEEIEEQEAKAAKAAAAKIPRIPQAQIFGELLSHAKNSDPDLTKSFNRDLYSKAEELKRSYKMPSVHLNGWKLTNFTTINAPGPLYTQKNNIIESCHNCTNIVKCSKHRNLQRLKTEVQLCKANHRDLFVKWDIIDPKNEHGTWEFQVEDRFMYSAGAQEAGKQLFAHETTLKQLATEGRIFKTGADDENCCPSTPEAMINTLAQRMIAQYDAKQKEIARVYERLHGDAREAFIKPERWSKKGDKRPPFVRALDGSLQPCHDFGDGKSLVKELRVLHAKWLKSKTQKEKKETEAAKRKAAEAAAVTSEIEAQEDEDESVYSMDQNADAEPHVSLGTEESSNTQRSHRQEDLLSVFRPLDGNGESSSKPNGREETSHVASTNTSSSSKRKRTSANDDEDSKSRTKKSKTSNEGTSDDESEVEMMTPKPVPKEKRKTLAESNDEGVDDESEEQPKKVARATTAPPKPKITIKKRTVTKNKKASATAASVAEELASATEDYRKTTSAKITTSATNSKKLTAPSNGNEKPTKKAQTKSTAATSPTGAAKTTKAKPTKVTKPTATKRKTAATKAAASTSVKKVIKQQLSAEIIEDSDDGAGYDLPRAPKSASSQHREGRALEKPLTSSEKHAVKIVQTEKLEASEVGVVIEQSTTIVKEVEGASRA